MLLRRGCVQYARGARGRALCARVTGGHATLLEAVENCTLYAVGTAGDALCVLRCWKLSKLCRRLC